jgi:SAM-dependent methyltransferase
MKARESGMPAEEVWESFFSPDVVLTKLQLAKATPLVVEFGCGYGTFTIPTARKISGQVIALEIDSEMVAATLRKVAAYALKNVQVIQRDFLANGSGLTSETADYAMVFNLLHLEQPEILLREASRIMKPAGLLGVVHWNYDATTPRGPSMTIRPQPEQCQRWAESCGFRAIVDGFIDLPPYHYGLLMQKVSAE